MVVLARPPATIPSWPLQDFFPEQNLILGVNFFFAHNSVSFRYFILPLESPVFSVRILGAGRMLESKAVIMIDAKMIETQMVADARCAKTCWGLQPAPPPARA